MGWLGPAWGSQWLREGSWQLPTETLPGLVRLKHHPWAGRMTAREGIPLAGQRPGAAPRAAAMLLPCPEQHHADAGMQQFTSPDEGVSPGPCWFSLPAALVLSAEASVLPLACPSPCASSVAWLGSALWVPVPAVSLLSHGRGHWGAEPLVPLRGVLWVWGLFVLAFFLFLYFFPGST